MSRDDLPDTLLEGTDLVHVSGYSFLEAGPRAAVSELLCAALAHAIPYSVDSGSSAVVREIAICFLNAAEAAALTGTNERAKQLDALVASFETVVITCGAAGACAATSLGTRRYFADTATVAPLDTSGAGDAFLAAFLTAYLRGESMERCLQRGARAGSNAVLHYGGRPVAMEGFVQSGR